MTVDVLVVAAAVAPAAGAWVAERVSTGVSGGDWLPAEVDGGGLPIAMARQHGKKQKLDWTPEQGLITPLASSGSNLVEADSEGIQSTPGAPKDKHGWCSSRSELKLTSHTKTWQAL